MSKRGFRADKPIRRGRASKGYTLHHRRLVFSAARVDRKGIPGHAEAIRTIKYPLAEGTSEFSLTDLARAIRHDSLLLYGPTNFSDWLCCHENGMENSYSFLDLWLDGLALGGVFQQSDRELRLLCKVVCGEDSKKKFFSLVLPLLRLDIADEIDIDGLDRFVFVNSRQRGDGDIGRRIDQVLRESSRDQHITTENWRSLQQEFSTLFPSLSGLDPLDKAAAKLGLLCRTDHREKARDICAQFLSGSTDSQTEDNEENLTFIFLPELKPVLNEHEQRIIRGEKIEAVLRQLRRFMDGSTLKINTLLALDNKQNALSNFGGTFLTSLLRADGVEIILKRMAARYPYKPSEIIEIKERISVLRRRALQLATPPEFVDNLGYYRTELGGKLSSWLSNRENYEKNISRALDSIKSELPKRKASLDSGNIAQMRSCVEKLRAQIDDLDMIVTRLSCHAKEESLLSPESRIIYDEAKARLAIFNSTWNEFKQQGIANSSKEANDRKRKRKQVGDENQKENELSLPKYPSFFGDERRILFARVADSPRLIKELLQSITKILLALDPSEYERITKEVEQRRLMTRCLARYRELRELQVKDSTLAAALRSSRFKVLADVSRGADFFRNEYARRCVEQIALPSALEAQEAINALKELVIQFIPKLDGNEQLVTTKDISIIRAAQFLMSLYARSDNPEMVWTVGNQLASMKVLHTDAAAYPKLAAFILFASQRTEKETSVLAARIGSEVIGLLGLLSKTNQFERYNLQAINGIHCDIFASKEDDSQKKRFAVGFPKWRANQKSAVLSDKYPIRFMAGNEALRDNKSGAQFEIRSSTYQMQFLRWAWKRPASKHGELEIGGTFLIAEQGTQLRVRGDRLTCAPVGSPRVYVSMPFQINVTISKKVDLSDERVIGVDVGEYGLAYAVVQKDSTLGGVPVLRVVASGVLRDGTHRALRDKVARLRRRQRQGVFLRSETTIAAARESLVGVYRNQLHSLLLKWRAPLVFEFNISVFEAGGSRIKTVYDTVKRADSYTNNEAQRSKQKHLWGINRPGTGSEVGAAFTSQTCSCCRRYYGDLLNENVVSREAILKALKAAQVVKSEQHYLAHEIELEGKRLRLFLPRSLRECAENNMNDDPHRRIKKHIKDYIRPPLWRIGKGALPKNAKRRRGNSSVFRCPFVDCGFLADADVQASFNLAARHFINQIVKEKKLADGESWRSIYESSFRTVPPKLDRSYFGPRSAEGIEANADIQRHRNSPNPTAYNFANS